MFQHPQNRLFRADAKLWPAMVVWQERPGNNPDAAQKTEQQKTIEDLAKVIDKLKAEREGLKAMDNPSYETGLRIEQLTADIADLEQSLADIKAETGASKQKLDRLKAQIDKFNGKEKPIDGKYESLAQLIIDIDTKYKKLKAIEDQAKKTPSQQTELSRLFMIYFDSSRYLAWKRTVAAARDGGIAVSTLDETRTLLEKFEADLDRLHKEVTKETKPEAMSESYVTEAKRLQEYVKDLVKKGNDVADDLDRQSDTDKAAVIRAAVAKLAPFQTFNEGAAKEALDGFIVQINAARDELEKVGVNSLSANLPARFVLKGAAKPSAKPAEVTPEQWSTFADQLKAYIAELKAANPNHAPNKTAIEEFEKRLKNITKIKPPANEADLRRLHAEVSVFAETAQQDMTNLPKLPEAGEAREAKEKKAGTFSDIAKVNIDLVKSKTKEIEDVITKYKTYDKGQWREINRAVAAAMGYANDADPDARDFTAVLQGTLGITDGDGKIGPITLKELGEAVGVEELNLTRTNKVWKAPEGFGKEKKGPKKGPRKTVSLAEGIDPQLAKKLLDAGAYRVAVAKGADGSTSVAYEDANNAFYKIDFDKDGKQADYTPNDGKQIDQAQFDTGVAGDYKIQVPFLKAAYIKSSKDDGDNRLILAEGPDAYSFAWEYIETSDRTTTYRKVDIDKKTGNRSVYVINETDFENGLKGDYKLVYQKSAATPASPSPPAAQTDAPADTGRETLSQEGLLSRIDEVVSNKEDPAKGNSHFIKSVVRDRFHHLVFANHDYTTHYEIVIDPTGTIDWNGKDIAPDDPLTTPPENTLEARTKSVITDNIQSGSYFLAKKKDSPVNATLYFQNREKTLYYKIDVTPIQDFQRQIIAANMDPWLSSIISARGGSQAPVTNPSPSPSPSPSATPTAAPSSGPSFTIDQETRNQIGDLARILDTDGMLGFRGQTQIRKQGASYLLELATDTNATYYIQVSEQTTWTRAKKFKTWKDGDSTAPTRTVQEVSDWIKTL